MPSATYALFREAILAEQQVVCSYDGRLANCVRTSSAPTGEREVVLAWQFGGERSGKLPQWRCLRLAEAETPDARRAGMKAALIGPRRPASARSISISTFTCGSAVGRRQRTIRSRARTYPCPGQSAFRRLARQEGRLAIVTNVRAGCGGRRSVRLTSGDAERVRRSRVVLTPRCWRQVSARLTLLAGRRWQHKPVTGESTK